MKYLLIMVFVLFGFTAMTNADYLIKTHKEAETVYNHYLQIQEDLVEAIQGVQDTESEADFLNIYVNKLTLDFLNSDGALLQLLQIKLMAISVLINNVRVQEVP